MIIVEGVEDVIETIAPVSLGDCMNLAHTSKNKTVVSSNSNCISSRIKSDPQAHQEGSAGI